MSSLKFETLKEKDLERLFEWFQEPIINRWYARNQEWSLDDIKKKYLPRIDGKENVPSFIVFIEDRPIGFIQYYLLTENFPEGIENQNNPLFKKFDSEDMVGIDLFIAEKMNRNKGLGLEILTLFIGKFLADKFKVIIVDPDKKNSQAIKFYLKSGFEITEYSENQKHIVMTRVFDQF